MLLELPKESDDHLDVVEEKTHVSLEHVMQCFNLVIEWAEEQGVDYSNVLVLRRLREKAISSTLTLFETK